MFAQNEPYIARAAQNTAKAINNFNEAVKKATKPNGQFNRSQLKSIVDSIHKLAVAQCNNAAVIQAALNGRTGPPTSTYQPLCRALNNISGKLKGVAGSFRRLCGRDAATFGVYAFNTKFTESLKNLGLAFQSLGQCIRNTKLLNTGANIDCVPGSCFNIRNGQTAVSSSLADLRASTKCGQ